MVRNPWFTLAIGLMVGLAVGYVLAERQPVPPAKAMQAATPASAAEGSLPEGHPPIDNSAGASNQRLQQQLSEIQTLLASNPDDPGLLTAMGNVYFDAEQWQDARVWYERSLQVAAGDGNVMTDLAVVYRNLTQPQRAIELLQQVVDADPEHWQAWYNMVVVLHFDLHRHDEAATALRRLQALKQQNPSIPDLSGLESEVLGG
jgi:tetratricopeptide (TPR) repeat protein